MTILSLWTTTPSILYVFPELTVVSELRWKLELMVRHTIFNGGEE